MLCFWRYKVLLYPFATQFLNYTIRISIWNDYYYFFFMIHCIYALVLGLHFSVKMFRFMPIFFFFWHMKKIYLVFFIFSIHFNVGSYWPQSVNIFFFLHTFRTTESSPVFLFFLFVCIDRECIKSHKILFHWDERNLFLLSKSRWSD